MSKYKVYSLITEHNYRDGWIILGKTEFAERELTTDEEILQFVLGEDFELTEASVEPNPNPREDSLFVVEAEGFGKPLYELIEIK